MQIFQVLFLDHFSIELLSGITVDEEDSFDIKIIAEDEDNNKVTSYSGSPTISSDCGDIRLASNSDSSDTLGIIPIGEFTPTLENGEATISVKLNRVGTATITVQDGNITWIS